jgi:hypothetical protein
MKKFLVLFMAPAASMAEWMQTPEGARKDEEAKMRTEWDTWTAAHAQMIKETVGTGKNTRVTKDSVKEVANDLMLYAIAEGETQQEVADAFKDHPHFGIPDAWIEVMPMRAM